jgi:hypothetical protein
VRKFTDLLNHELTRLIAHSTMIALVVLILHGPPWAAFLAACFNGWAHCMLKAVVENRPKIEFNMNSEGMEVTETTIDKDGNVQGPRKL